jgi:hypothetical protein
MENEKPVMDENKKLVVTKLMNAHIPSHTSCREGKQDFSCKVLLLILQQQMRCGFESIVLPFISHLLLEKEFVMSFFNEFLMKRRTLFYLKLPKA